jgi:hypothetical protein
MSLLITLLAGVSCKLYDDLNDNTLLYKFKNNIIMEILKGIHFITFVTVSVDDPLFFILFYIGCFINFLGNNDAWESDYEKSLFYSFLLLFLIIDYTKISSKYSIYDIVLIISLFIALFTEKVIMQNIVKNNNEVSLAKLNIRILILILIFILYLILSNKTIKNLLIYSFGYFSVSILIQYYSLTLIQDKKDQDKKDQDKKDQDKKDQDKKDQDKKDQDKKDEE